MDGSATRSAEDDQALRVAQVHWNDADPIGKLTRKLGPGPFELVCLFVSPRADFHALNGAAKGAFGRADVFACTTAGEIGATGYEEGQIIAIGFPSTLFSVDALVIDGLDAINDREVIDRLMQRRLRLSMEASDMTHEFAFLLVDGLSLQEENIASVLAPAMGPMPLFGGSTGDGTNFDTTWLSYNGQVRQNAALLALVRSRCPVQVFSVDHFEPTDIRMVVTRAAPDHRTVLEINAEPAATEYARLLGKDLAQLDTGTFAAHPLVVRLGHSHHVRSIRKVGEDGSLLFFSAINEGMVLTLAETQDMAHHLENALQNLGRDGAPTQILGCDCLLRRLEAEQFQQTRALSQILSRHRVTGFNTYGEQHGALHVNQTLTGVAFYPPDQD
ncbi:FIST C-terminal domain-containing protein [Citreicella sp. C3M06]|uniref:FIST N-terminal domain-containing protein n=1 Tax=Citreicella sp. C3M06 TaxID=2841564 RepID=UPI001C08ECD7|nr:FIST N-terminal domain-containing protein [Citreicella sp. C3M06]MBU2962351.1 FIST C-terminal domain-containing protein [Citreicella sp. C3M06]